MQAQAKFGRSRGLLKSSAMAASFSIAKTAFTNPLGEFLQDGSLDGEDILRSFRGGGVVGINKGTQV